MPLSRRDEPQPTDNAADEEVAAQALESDPGGNGPRGLSGDLGVSSGIRGEDVGSSVSGTHGARPVRLPPVEDPPPEQSPDAAVGGPETPTPEDPPTTASSRSTSTTPGRTRTGESGRGR